MGWGSGSGVVSNSTGIYRDIGQMRLLKVI